VTICRGLWYTESDQPEVLQRNGDKTATFSLIFPNVYISDFPHFMSWKVFGAAQIERKNNLDICKTWKT